MARPARSPLEGVDRVLVDGSNLLHALRRGATPLPAAALIGRLRASIPPAVGIELVFDGPPEPGLRNERIASGLIVRHAGRRSGDALLVSLVEDARAAAGARGADNVLVVTDDRDLRSAIEARGAHTARTAWLLTRLERRVLDAPATGNRRPPRSPGAAPEQESAADDARAGWRPGRGATTKRGNPRRAPHHR